MLQSKWLTAGRELIKSGWAFTFLEDGEIIGAAGLVDCYTWAVFKAGPTRGQFLFMVRHMNTVENIFIAVERKPLIAEIGTEFEQGQRLATLLGYRPTDRYTSTGYRHWVKDDVNV